MKKSKVLAFYLPQFHPTKENDEWWGKGFTEWTNVGKARRLFPGHYQPRVPADLGYYDLRVSETREAQAKMAKEAGIDGFCYWHYWFEDGRELLQRPFDEVLSSGTPDFPFCLAWANENWYAKLWDKDGSKDKLLIEQKYDIEDFKKHFYKVLPAFKDSRYIKIDEKPVFVIYKPLANDLISVFMDIWNRLAVEEGLPGIYWVAHCFNSDSNVKKIDEMHFDTLNILSMNGYKDHISILEKGVKKIIRTIFKMPLIINYNKVVRYLNESVSCSTVISPTILAGWDHTPRSGAKGTVLNNYNPNSFRKHVENVLEIAKTKDSPFIFIKSWNEWAEGNYLEPDLKYGSSYLDILRDELRERK